MANICCDDVYFFSDDNTEGIEALWKDLQASITPGYKDDLGQIERLFLHAGLFYGGDQPERNCCRHGTDGSCGPAFLGYRMETAS